jgi:hypothetical protein
VCGTVKPGSNPGTLAETVKSDIEKLKKMTF